MVTLVLGVCKYRVALVQGFYSIGSHQYRVTLVQGHTSIWSHQYRYHTSRRSHSYRVVLVQGCTTIGLHYYRVALVQGCTSIGLHQYRDALVQVSTIAELATYVVQNCLCKHHCGCQVLRKKNLFAETHQRTAAQLSLSVNAALASDVMDFLKRLDNPQIRKTVDRNHNMWTKKFYGIIKKITILQA